MHIMVEGLALTVVQVEILVFKIQIYCYQLAAEFLEELQEEIYIVLLERQKNTWLM